MSAGSVGGGGLGTTVVLGARFTRSAGEKLAQTGAAGMRLVLLVATGLASVAAGVFLKGRGRQVRVGEPLE